MKRILSILLLIAIPAALLPGCGKKAQAHGSSRDYAEVIASVRSQEENEVFPVVTSQDDERYDMVFEVLGGDDGNMERYALSIGVFITQAYGLGIVLPQEGAEQQVREQLEGFVDAQRKAFENYLPDQYEIAQNALVDTAATGEVLLVMASNAADVMAALKKGLQA